ncbi:MAG TPA: non-homologous end-joining DNA ligase [Stackebrandtia sp.]|jgi:bifunctional non-homologous end joining protein LigD|uniref:non-homologous end-joining DNA ligase n=1 Tax=Stackebrandtia sp. TaxID=2023065 RepID=UPI002D45140C|nr:non-homologous end-joining DNA ligase [Stackebrandtia sp.]HZE41510.1 non-homologous end-joining DNA ligase [Stackebrandtia sp.]
MPRSSHHVDVSHPDKVMYPDGGVTKRDVVDYYRRIAPVMLPHIVNRPVTRIRYPNGTGEKSFYEKNAPKSTPDWVRTENVATPGSTKGRDSLDYVVAEDAESLAWMGNQAALELHVPQWHFRGHRSSDRPDRLIADLDPGRGAGLDECVATARLLRDRFAADGLDPYVKSSGKHGIHVCCPIAGTQTDATVSAYAKSVAVQLSTEHPSLVTARMPKAEREGKVFIDWSQNNAAKTTVAPYSLRGLNRATVSAPLTWDELDDPRMLPLGPNDVLDRVEKSGDLWSPLLEPGPTVPKVDG